MAAEHDIREKIGAMDAKISAAHARVDRLETGVREDLKELKKEFRELRDNINSDLKALNAHMNRGKGWAAAMLLLAGSAGAGVVKLLALLAK